MSIPAADVSSPACIRTISRLAGLAAFVAVLGAAVSLHAAQAAAAKPEASTDLSSYRVGPQDVLDVSVWRHEELSGKFTVSDSGAFAFPLIGSVQAGQRTVDDIRAELTRRLSDGYLKDPQVSVTVQQYVSQKVFVMGEVHTPGPIPLTGSITLLEALARAGSLTEQAGGELVVLRNADAAARTTEGPLAPGQSGTSEVARVDVQQLRRGAPIANVQLRSGDSIFVPRAETVFVLGLVNNPGAYTLETGLTVLRAISLAGGAAPLGSTGRVRILRVVNGEKKEIKANLDDVLKPGDTVVVHARVF